MSTRRTASSTHTRLDNELMQHRIQSTFNRVHLLAFCFISMKTRTANTCTIMKNKEECNRSHNPVNLLQVSKVYDYMGSYQSISLGREYPGHCSAPSNGEETDVGLIQRRKRQRPETACRDYTSISLWQIQTVEEAAITRVSVTIPALGISWTHFYLRVGSGAVAGIHHSY